MPQEEAGVIPFQPWIVDGWAEVTQLPPSMGYSNILPLENEPTGQMTVSQMDFPAGVVVIPPSTQLAGSDPATLPLQSTSKKDIRIDNGGSQNPNGVVVLFTSKK
ncbi:MAG: hypothetical protein ACE5IO_02355 [Thermoplasmata archaeon]